MTFGLTYSRIFLAALIAICCCGSGVEHVLGKDGVGGSIPPSSSNKKPLKTADFSRSQRFCFLINLQFMETEGSQRGLQGVTGVTPGVAPGVTFRA